jgi:hypothetical protein
MPKWILITAFAAFTAINVAQVVRPIVLQTFGDINTALQFANHQTRR